MKRALLIIGIAGALASWQSCTGPSTPEAATGDEGGNDSVTLGILHDAYLYSFPLVVMDLTRSVSTNVEKPGIEGYAPMNQISHRSAFPDYTFTAVVKPNCDTYYSSAWMDLKAGPLVLTAPATDRYYLLPLLDAYSNVFASPGTRTTGKGAHRFLLTGPGWKGQVPKGMEQIQAPTNLIWLIGRTQVNSKEDGAKVVGRIQQGFTITPLNDFGKPYTAPMGKIDSSLLDLVPSKAIGALGTLGLINRALQMMVDNPPSAGDSSILGRMARIGLLPGQPIDTSKFSAGVREKLDMIPQQVLEELKKEGLGSSESANGWKYNLKVAKFGTDYMLRAGVALFGLGANLAEDAVYPNAETDSAGLPLESDHKYLIHFAKNVIPPVHAFWSLTLYNEQNFLAENPIGRYTLGSRSKLHFNPDGSLDLYLQRENPGKDKEENWLPTPKQGKFVLTLRLYWPEKAILDGSWKPPVVQKIS